MAFVYILKSLKDGKFYTGSTSNLSRRLKEHKDGKCKSTSYRRPLSLMYFEEYDSILEARVREKILKHPTKGKKKKELVESFPQEKLEKFTELK